MKKLFFLIITLLVLFQGHAFAKNTEVKGTEEDEIDKQAKELTYSGQLDKAAELMGKEKPSKMNVSDGWAMTSMMMGLIWGCIGTGYFMYGKKASRFGFLICGIVLCVFPMLISDDTLSLVIGLVMTIAPFKLDF